MSFNVSLKGQPGQSQKPTTVHKLKSLLSNLRTSSSEKGNNSLSGYVVKENGTSLSMTKENKDAIIAYLEGETFSVEFSQILFKRCDEQLAECQKFIEEAKETIQFTSNANKTENALQSPLAMGANRINRWRSKQKQNNLYNKYDSIIVNRDSCAVTLNYMIEKSLSNMNNLVDQCQHLKPRLQACVSFNTKELEHQSPIVRETSLVLELLKESEATMQTMLQFYDEVGSMKENEDRLKEQAKQAYVPWALRNIKQEEVPDEPPVEQIKRKTLEKRTKKIQKLIKIVDTKLNIVTKEYDKRKKDFERCTKAFNTMEGLMKKLVLNHSIDIDDERDDSDVDENKSVVITEVNANENQQEWTEKHAQQCADCSCTFTMVNECLLTLGTNQFVAEQATSKNKQLMTLQERLSRYAKVLEDLEWGSKASESSPVKEVLTSHSSKS